MIKKLQKTETETKICGFMSAVFGITSWHRIQMKFMDSDRSSENNGVPRLLRNSHITPNRVE